MTDEPTDGVVVDAVSLEQFTAAVLRGAGLADDAADVVSDTLVDANLRGIDTHGVVRLEPYADRLEAGGIDPDPDLSVSASRPGAAVVDADDGPGQVATLRATDEAVDRAGDAGAAFVGVCNSNHYGTASYYTNHAADRGCVGICMTHSGPNVAPFGGADPFFGTNPLSISIPREEGFHVTLDMATSVVAKGAVILAREEGEEIPPEWALDESGEPTTNPEAFHALRPVGGPKGYGLAFVIDALCGALLDTAVGEDVSTLYDDKSAPQGIGHMVAAVDVEAFTDRDGYERRVGSLVDQLSSARPAEGFDEVLLPGEPEACTRAERLADGVPLGSGVVDTLRTLGHRYDVAFPEI